MTKMMMMMNMVMTTMMSYEMMKMMWKNGTSSSNHPHQVSSVFLGICIENHTYNDDDDEEDDDEGGDHNVDVL